MSEIKNEIKQFVIRELIYDNANEMLSEDQSLLESGIIDSLGIMKLLDFFEEKYGFTIDGDEILPENFENILTLSDLVQSKRDAKMVN